MLAYMLNIIILISMDRARGAPPIETLTKTDTWRCYMTGNINLERQASKYSSINREFREGLQQRKAERKERTKKRKNARKVKQFFSFA